MTLSFLHPSNQASRASQQKMNEFTLTVCVGLFKDEPKMRARRIHAHFQPPRCFAQVDSLRKQCGQRRFAAGKTVEAFEYLRWRLALALRIGDEYDGGRSLRESLFYTYGSNQQGVRAQE